jgi:hypothetical protein
MALGATHSALHADVQLHHTSQDHAPSFEKKLDDRSWQTIFVDYEAGSKAYRCYDPTAQRVIISRDVVFDEAGKWHWEDNNTEPMVDSDLFTIEYTTELVHAPALAVAMPSPSPIPAAPPVGEDVAMQLLTPSLMMRCWTHITMALHFAYTTSVTLSETHPWQVRHAVYLSPSSTSPQPINQLHSRRHNNKNLDGWPCTKRCKRSKIMEHESLPRFPLDIE